MFCIEKWVLYSAGQKRQITLWKEIWKVQLEDSEYKGAKDQIQLDIPEDNNHSIGDEEFLKWTWRFKTAKDRKHKNYEICQEFTWEASFGEKGGCSCFVV